MTNYSLLMLSQAVREVVQVRSPTGARRKHTPKRTHIHTHHARLHACMRTPARPLTHTVAQKGFKGKVLVPQLPRRSRLAARGEPDGVRDHRGLCLRVAGLPALMLGRGGRVDRRSCVLANTPCVCSFIPFQAPANASQSNAALDFGSEFSKLKVKQRQVKPACEGMET